MKMSEQPITNETSKLACPECIGNGHLVKLHEIRDKDGVEDIKPEMIECDVCKGTGRSIVGELVFQIRDYKSSFDLESMALPNWSHGGQIRWEHYVSPEVSNLWARLCLESKLVAYLDAISLASRDYSIDS